MPKRGSRANTANPVRTNELSDEGMELRELDAQEQPEERKAASSLSKDIQEFMKTPVRHRSRAAASENKWDSGVAHQFQTPERHRSDLASLVFSPQTNQFASPGVGLASPDLVPLFQPSPKRTLLSPQQQSGVNSFGNIFQSPVRAGDLQASDFLRFETPSSKSRFGGLFSPSPVRGKRHTPCGQLRQRAVSLEARGWQLGGVPGAGADGFGDVQHLMHAPEDDQEDLIKDFLQSPGPKEVHQEVDRPQTRSRSTLAPPDTADRDRRLQHPHRRALDFSRADTVRQDFHSLTGKRLTRHSSSQAAALGAAAVSAAEEREQQQLGDALLQPQLPLIPLDLSECGKHNPNSPFKQITGTGITPRRGSRRQQQQQSALDAVLVSPRSALDAAMAHITQAAMPSLLQTSNLEALQGEECLEFPINSADALKGLHPGLLKPAFETLNEGGAAATGAAGSKDTAEAPAALAMIPLGTMAAGVEPVGAMEQQQQLPLEFLQQQFEQYQEQLQAYEAAVAQNAADDQVQERDDDGDDAMSDSPQPQQQRRRQQQQQHYQVDSDSDYEDSQPAAAAAVRTSSRRMVSSKRWNLRPHGKKQYSIAELQPSRRSRRLAGDTPDAVLEQQQESRSTPGSSGRSGKQQSRTAALQREDSDQQELEAAHSLQQQEQDAAEALQTANPRSGEQQQLDADQEVTAAEEAAAATADEECEELEQPRTRSSSRRCANQKGRKSGRKPSSKNVTDDSGLETEQADTDAAAAAAGMYGLPPVTGLQQFLQSGGLLQLPNGVTVPIGMTPNKGGIALLGPNTPDDMRMAHITQPYGMPVRSCNCKKSQCLKLYCDCFANNVFCNGCSCADCRNVESNHTEVIARRSQIQQRDPTAFTAKLAATDADTLANRKGCKCKKSHCLKKYCECFQMGVRCADLCKCSDCRNIEDGTNSLAKKLMPRTLHSAASGPSSTARLPHHQQFWPLAPGLGAAAAATPATSAAMGLGSVLLRIPGGPNTPGSGQLMCLPLQSSADQAAAAAAAALAQIQGSITEQPPTAAAAGGNQNRVAKPLLPQFLKSAAATAAAGLGTPVASNAGGKVDAARSQDASAAAAAATRDEDDDGTCLLSEEELPTAEQQAALECAAQITAQQQQQHHLSLASPASSSGGHSSRGDFNRGPSPARALNLDRMASQEGSVLRSNSLSSPISALQAFHAAAAAAAAGAGVSPVDRQQSPAAAGSSSAGGALHGSPRTQSGIGSASSKVVKQHRLASTSRADDYDMVQYGAPYKQHNPLQQQPQQQQGILALVGAAAAAGPAAQAQQQQQQTVGVTTRRQLLQQTKHEADTEAALANSHKWARPPGRSLQPQALFGGAAGAAMAPPASYGQHSTVPAAAAASGLVDHLITPEKSEPAEEGVQNIDDDISPVQPVVLGPNGPTVNLSQRALTTAMNQSVAALGSSAGTVPSAAAAGAAGDEPSQAVGMLMTVIDEQGQMQYYFLPSGQVPPGTSPSVEPAAQPQSVGISPQETVQPSTHQQQQQQQQSHYQLRRRPANPLQGTGLSQLPEDMIIDQIDQHTAKQQQPAAAAAATAGKQPPPSPSNGRCLRSSNTVMNGSSPARTPGKRATPVKRKAADADEQQDPADTAARGSPCKIQASTAKPQHRLDQSQSQHQQQQKLRNDVQNDQHRHEHSPPPPQQQQQPVSARQVLLSPVKRTRGGGLVVLPPQQQQQDCGVQLGSQEASNTVPGTMLSPLQGIPISPEQISTAAGVGVEAAVHYMQYLQQQAEEPLAAADASHQILQQQQPQAGMQLFVASTADGQQYLLQAPIGTDPATLMQPNGTVDAVCLGALGSSVTAAAAEGGGGFSDHQLSAIQIGQPFSSPVRPMPLHLHSPGLQRQASTPSGSALSGDFIAPSSGGSSGGRRSRDLGALSPQRPKVMLSPRDTRTRDGSLFKFSPGCTTVFSPTKPKLGSSPSKSRFNDLTF